MAVVYDATIARDFTKRRLQRDAVGIEVARKCRPPGRLPFDDLGELSFRYAILQTRFDQHFAVDTAVPQRLRHGIGQLFTAAGCALIDRDDLHRGCPPLSLAALYAINY